MVDSDSSLSSAPSTDDEMAEVVAPVKATKPTPQKKKGKGSILAYLKTQPPSPPRKKRPASPPHEMVPEDNPDIAVSASRVNRVVSRRDGAHHSLDLRSSPPANIFWHRSLSCLDRDSRKHSRQSAPISDRKISSEAFLIHCHPHKLRVSSAPSSG